MVIKFRIDTCERFSEIVMFYKDKLLSPAQLKRLNDHKYSCSSISLVDPLLQPWWNWLVSKTPLWIAPNLITILGLIVNILTTLILVWYSPDAKIEVCVCPTYTVHEINTVTSWLVMWHSYHIEMYPFFVNVIHSLMTFFSPSHFGCLGFWRYTAV